MHDIFLRLSYLLSGVIKRMSIAYVMVVSYNCIPIRACRNAYPAGGRVSHDKVCPDRYKHTAENRLAVVKQGSNVLMAVMYDGDTPV